MVDNRSTSTWIIVSPLLWWSQDSIRIVDTPVEHTFSSRFIGEKIASKKQELVATCFAGRKRKSIRSMYVPRRSNDTIKYDKHSITDAHSGIQTDQVISPVGCAEKHSWNLRCVQSKQIQYEIFEKHGRAPLPAIHQVLRLTTPRG